MSILHSLINSFPSRAGEETYLGSQYLTRFLNRVDSNTLVQTTRCDLTSPFVPPQDIHPSSLMYELRGCEFESLGIIEGDFAR